MDQKQEQQSRERFVPMERREIRGIALSTILMIIVPLFSIIGVYYQLSNSSTKNANQITELEKKIEILNTRVETHNLKHSDCEKWRAVMEERFKNLNK